MDTRSLIARSKIGLELEQALAEWIAASRRAYDPTRDLRDELEEHAAWRRLQVVLDPAETASAP